MSETVLVIDDHSLVLSTLVCTLTHAGFHVLSAASGEEAIEIAEKLGKPLDLMICDLILPGMPGTEIARCIGEIHPEARCLFITGLPGYPHVADETALSGQALLAKPFLPQVLVRKVREIMGSGPRVLTAVM
jgi:DNA-binding NarL/FixJ family response regulator